MKKMFIPTSLATSDEKEALEHGASWASNDFYDPKSAFLRDALELAQEEIARH